MTSDSLAIVTHEMGFARVAASRIMFLEQGCLIEDTTPSEFLNTPQWERKAVSRKNAVAQSILQINRLQ
ncbi:MAG: hypothetical protein KME57_08700 [Scytonema hyalinum WJT4-NPBG1]|jgi:ABC-type polar amino acid transport system ATPase subunit|nr:hypothetical protein [Scytonema hyalinum WJT4-NPBG1]